MRRMTRLVGMVALAVLTTGAVPGGVGAQRAAATSLSVPGLTQPVEVIRDRWGLNHIYAQNEADLFLAQGYLAAKDRLFQFEVWRRRATGTVAEILGPRELKRDLGTRLHMYRGDIDAELQHYHPRGKAIVEAYVRGVNAYVDEAMRDPASLPIEFKMLGITPGKWTPQVVISRHQALTSNVPNEATHVRAIGALGSTAKLRELLLIEGGEPALTLDPLIDPKTFPADVLAVYDAFRDPIEFAPADVAAAYRAAARAAALDAGGAGDRGLPAEARSAKVGRVVDTDIGSNNWVISGRLTQSTHPIMANDPHRVIEAPSLRYWVHLVAPGWNVIGGGEPVLPGVSIGHNEYGAWGLTIFGSDSEDLYVYETNPANPNEYRYQGRWEAMRVVPDTIPVKGQADAKVELKFTRHGPVLHEDRANRRAYALRAAWMEQGGAPYLASLRMNQARTWEEFRDACSYNRMPSENMVWVDKKGNIGWQAAGIAPLRSWSGLLPVPGDGRFEWEGYLPITALPSEANPARGYVATANHYLFPNDYAYDAARHWTWADPYRARRIEEVLGSGMRFSIAEVARLQNDDLSLPARALVPLLRDLPFSNPAVATARDALLQLELRARQELAGSRGVRAVHAAALRRRAPGGDSGRGPRRRARQPGEPQEDHRLDVRPRRPLRRRPDQGARRAGGLQLRGRRRRGDQAVRARHGGVEMGRREAAPRADPPPAVERGERRDEEEARGRAAAPRRRRHHGERHRRQRQPGVRRVAQDHHRHPGLGQQRRAEHARPVGRPRRSALPRPVRAVGARALLPGGLLASEGGIGGRAHHVADAPRRHVGLRRAGP